MEKGQAESSDQTERNGESGSCASRLRCRDERLCSATNRKPHGLKPIKEGRSRDRLDELGA